MMSRVNPNKAFFASLFAVIFFVTYNYTLTIIAAPYIGSDLGASHDISSYTTSFYAMGNALTIPLGAHLLGRMRHSTILTLSLLSSVLLSLIAPLSPHYSFFLCVRFLQGVVVGPLFPVIFNLTSTLGPPDKKAHFVTLFLTIFIVVPALSACFGGSVAYIADWRIPFYMQAPLISLLAYDLWKRLRLYRAEFQPIPFDGIGFLLYAMAIVGVSLALILGQELDWQRSSFILFCAFLGVFSAIFFIFWELHTRHPLLDLKLFKNFVFSFALFQVVILFSAYFGMVVLLGLWLNLTVNYTPNWIALILANVALGGLFPTFLILKGYHKIDCRIPLFIAISLFLLSCFHATYFNQEINFGRIALSRIAAGFGLALFLPPLFRLCFRTFSEEKGLSVVSLFQVSRILGTGLGVPVYTTLWQRRQVFYHQRLGGALTPFSEQTRDYFSRAKFFGLSEAQARVELNHLLDRQASALALEDCFYLMCGLLLLLLILILLTYGARVQGFIPEEKNEAKGESKA